MVGGSSFSTDDSIVAVATPPGRGGIGIVRISGPDAARIAAEVLERPRPLRARYATRARARGAGIPDEVIATYFPAPHSYTGEHVVEISAHGSPLVLGAIVDAALAAGARLAEPGEFTLRAFLNGKRDLVQAEAVADLVDAVTPRQARAACDQLEGTLTSRIADVDSQLFDLIARLEASLDFPDEGYHFVQPAEASQRIDRLLLHLDRLLAGARQGRLIREGATVVVVGRPNVGKSSLFNRLLGADRAIVTEIAGTTRDLVAEKVDLGGLAVTLVDTAGARDAVDIVEQEGVRRAAAARAVADLLLVVVDASAPAMPEDRHLLEETTDRPRIVVENKSDLPRRFDDSGIEDAGPRLSVSARSGCGIDALRDAVVTTLSGREALRDTAAVTNARHIRLLEQARRNLAAARELAARGEAPEEIVLSELQAARGWLDEVVGRRTSEDVLRHIFERFCIGK